MNRKGKNESRPVVKYLTDYEFEIEVVLDPHNENIVKEVRLFDGVKKWSNWSNAYVPHNRI